MDIEDFNHESINFAFPNASPQSLRQLSLPRNTPNMSHEITQDVDQYLPSQYIIDDSEEDYVTEDDAVLPEPTASGRSSVSSFPASVIHHNITPSQTYPIDALRTPPRSRAGTPTYKPASPLSARDHITGFRNPSSVRALQMRDEFSDEDMTPGHKRHGSRMSYSSYRLGSAHSTPGKRTSRSLQGSPVKTSSKLRKEFPLVLLHCTILPSMISPKVKAVSEELLEAIIPEPYKKRWKLLQEKIVKNFEVRERGVLIPHPKEDYELLEERLLETLELERSVISNGHFVGRSESRASTADSGFGSEENSNRGDVTDEEVDDSRCADCGGHLCGERRWEVKVYAANGLMKAGAWGAAWSEMEKVDVQVGVILPEEVRREVEARLDAVIAQEQLLQEEKILGKSEMPDDERTKEIYGEASLQRQEVIDGLDDQRQPSRAQQPATPEKPKTIPQAQSVPEQVDLRMAVINYIRLLLQDRRNIAILLMAAFILFYGTASKPLSTTEKSINIEYETTTIVSTSISTSVAIETSTITKTAQIALPSTSPIVEVARLQSSLAVEVFELVADSGSLPKTATVESIESSSTISAVDDVLASMVSKMEKSITAQDEKPQEAAIEDCALSGSGLQFTSTSPLEVPLESSIAAEMFEARKSGLEEDNNMMQLVQGENSSSKDEL